MVLFGDPSTSEEIGGAFDADGQLPFLEVAQWLAQRTIPVPDVYIYDDDVHVVLLEDLSDMTLERALSDTNRIELYEQALELLITFQSNTRLEDPSALPASLQKKMSREVLAWELAHYVEWRLVADRKQIASSLHDQLWVPFERLVDELCALPTRLIHRDFQSRNLMLPRPEHLVLIDFQDAMIGPYIYDLVALLRDSYVALMPNELEHLLERYIVRAREEGIVDGEPDPIERAFHLQTIQRKLKDTGRFVYIDRVKGNPAFLDYRESSMAYVRHALSKVDGFEDLTELLARLDPPQ